MMQEAPLILRLYEKCPYCSMYLPSKLALELHLEIDHEMIPVKQAP